jgi:hypothetical protein
LKFAITDMHSPKRTRLPLQETIGCVLSWVLCTPSTHLKTKVFSIMRGSIGEESVVVILVSIYSVSSNYILAPMLALVYTLTELERGKGYRESQPNE